MNANERVAQSSDIRYKGFILSIDSFLPVYIGFTFPPSGLKDDFSANFSWVSAPASRYNYPIFQGVSPRIISFTLKYDQSYPIACTLGKVKNAEKYGTEDKGGVKLWKSIAIRNLMSAFETLKLPKQGISNNIVLNLIGKFKKTDVSSEPAPPLCILSTAVDKYSLGYVSKASVGIEKRNKFSIPTRISVNVEFLVVPDLIFSTLEDVYRISGTIMNTVDEVIRTVGSLGG